MVFSDESEEEKSDGELSPLFVPKSRSDIEGIDVSVETPVPAKECDSATFQFRSKSTVFSHKKKNSKNKSLEG